MQKWLDWFWLEGWEEDLKWFKEHKEEGEFHAEQSYSFEYLHNEWC